MPFSFNIRKGILVSSTVKIINLEILSIIQTLKQIKISTICRIINLSRKLNNKKSQDLS